MKATMSLFFFFIFNFYIGYSAPLKIILKLDDLMVKNSSSGFLPTMNYLVEKQIKFSAGIIAQSCDNTTLSTLTPYISAMDSDSNKLLEIWNHGLDHVIPEYSARDYHYQKNHFEKADKLIYSYISTQMHSFGTPGNTSDTTTNKVILENKNYKVFMLSSVQPNSDNGILYLNQRVEIENGTGNCDYTYFLKNFNRYKNIYIHYMILQGHPNAWSNEELEQFKLIIDFLLAQGCEFILPYEYYLSLQIKAQPSLNAKLISSKQVRLTWTDKDSLKINYKIERTEDSIHWGYVGKSTEYSKNIFIDNNIKTKSGKYYYRIRPDIGIKTVYSNVVCVAGLSTNEIELPIQDSLSFSIFPNPGFGEVSIKIILAKAENVTCDIYNLTGTIEKRLFYQQIPIGISHYTIDISNFNTGIYFCRLKTSSCSLIKKLIITNN